jgi:peptide/nickel transport system permease protein
MQFEANKDQPIPVETTPMGQVVPMPSRRIPRLTVPFWVRSVLKSRKATIGLVILLTFAFLSIFAPVLAPGDPTDFVDRPHLSPSRGHLLGTTGQGQDVFDQTVWGGRLTLQVGVMVGILTTIVGVGIGMTAGYFRGKVDDLLSLIMNVFLIVPALPLLVTLAAFLGSGSTGYFVFVLTITGWAWPARIMRSQVLSLREKEFVAAAKVSGERNARIIFGEILPNMTSIVVASFFGSTLFAIGAASGLEFLGLGNPSVVSWGTNLYWAGNNAGLLTGAWWTFVPAGACIALVAFACALMNYAIDEITNPRLRAQGETRNALKRQRRTVRVAASRGTPVIRPSHSHGSAD